MEKTMDSLKKLFKNKSCLVVAEIAQAHEGSLGMAHAYIDAVADAGVDAVKFQTHIAEAESTIDEPWRVKFSYQDRTRYEYWKRMEFTPIQWQGLAEHARQKNILFFSSPFSLEAVDLLEILNIPIWKIGSGEITNKPLIEKILKTGKPIFISTGMGTLEELDTCIQWIKDAGNQFVVLQCTSAYPCPPEKVGLNLLEFYHDRYQSFVGFSDHSGTIYPGVIATYLGASVIEVHVTFSEKAFGPDVEASLTIDELRNLVGGVNFASELLANPVEALSYQNEFSDLRKVFYKSIVAKKDLSVGSVITESDVMFKKPGSGISPARLDEFLGRKLIKAVSKDQQLKDEYFKG